jgi:DNA-binding MarR family transcriptional regulator
MKSDERDTMLLEEISAKLDILISIMKIGQAHSIEILKNNMSKFELEVYQLCDGKKTVSDIADALGKKIQQVSSYIDTLEKKGLVRHRRIGKNKYYMKTIE